MDIYNISSMIALMLATLWDVQKSSAFSDYLLRNCGRLPQQMSPCSCIFIAESEQGDFQEQFVGGLVTQWWIVDDIGLRESDSPAFAANNSVDQDALFPTPIIRFYHENGRALIYETWGPTIVSMKEASLRVSGRDLFLEDTQVLWTYDTL